MKRLRSSDDLDSYGEKWVFKDWGRKDEDLGYRASSHRSFYYKSDNGRKGMPTSSPRYDRLEDDRDCARMTRKRPEYDGDNHDNRRKNYEGYNRDGGDRGFVSSSPRSGFGPERIYRSESFSGSRREFPKRFRSERDRSRREGSVSSWRRFGGGKDYDEGTSMRSSGDSTRGNTMAQDGTAKLRSPQGLRDAKSPPWSRDSGSERSKSTEVKKSEDLPPESGSSSEMEEGELEPDTVAVSMVERVAEDQASTELNLKEKVIHGEAHVEKKLPQDEIKISCVEKMEIGKESKDREVEVQPLEKILDADEREVDSVDSPTTLSHGISNCKDMESVSNNDVIEDEECVKGNDKSIFVPNDAHVDKSSSLEVQKEECIGLEHNSEETDLFEQKTGVTEENEASRVASPAMEDGVKDKGKGVAISSTNGCEYVDEDTRIEGKTRDLLTLSDNDTEGPSSRGFEFFFSGPPKKVEKQDPMRDNKPNAEKMALEPLELSLSLPNVLMPIGSHNSVQAPGSPSQARSVQSFPSSFQTFSDGFTASMSFSGSQHFTHNPSCSLTHNSLDNNEQSVKSRPLFQGVDWQALSSDDRYNKEVTICPNVLSNGNGSFDQLQMSQGILNGHATTMQNICVAEGSSKILRVLDRQTSFQEQFSSAQLGKQPDVRKPSRSIGSYDNGSECHRKKIRTFRDQGGGASSRNGNQLQKEQQLAVGADIVERIIAMIISEPLHTMAGKFSDMTLRSIACLKDSTRDIILNQGKQLQLRAFQKALDSRSDITTEMLLKSHPAQLEVMVSLKTGVQEYLTGNNDVSSSDLAEIFLYLRCRNPTCRNTLPVDECDCKICSQKNGFCNNCMCLVCSKFDNALNTCSWVGCDVCQHWCHADCGLRESYIRNGHRAKGAPGTTEMQFHCLACGHSSEMYGFVKEVFQNFVKEWTAEALSKELDYVRRIFCTSNDVRGKRLYETSVQMLSRLANKGDLQLVQNHIAVFLSESDSFISGEAGVSCKEQASNNNLGESSKGITGSSHEAHWLKSVGLEKASQSDKAAGLLPSFAFDRTDKPVTNSDVRINTKEPVFDELDSIIRIKQAEARMFQTRADEARQEAEGLKRIAVSKKEKIEEEYTNRVTKLRLPEAEEMHRQKLEELHTLEKAYQDYFNLKTRMEADIKDLLLKMEATRRNLSF